jgi:AraC-like DNA-binding protein
MTWLRHRTSAIFLPRCLDLINFVQLNATSIIPMDVADQRRRQLCAMLFNDPSMLAETITHEIRGSFSIARHVHDDRLQFDLIVGCRGTAFVGDNHQSLCGVSTMFALPGEPHGYELKRTGPAVCRVYHVKLKCDGQLARQMQGVFSSLVTGLEQAESLSSALRVVVQLGYVRQMRGGVLLPRLAEVLCLWPRINMADDQSWTTHASDDLPTGLAAAVAMIDARVNDPPSLEELAEIASLSPRHFSRQFQQRFGCTAYTYATGRRVAAARELLLDSNHRVLHVAHELGFPSIAIFSRWFKQQVGVSPRQYRSSPTTM